MNNAKTSAAPGSHRQPATDKRTAIRKNAARSTAVAAIILTGLSACSGGDATTTTPAPSQPSETATDQADSGATDSPASDTGDEATEDSSAENNGSGTGTFTATGDYRSPGGSQQVEVSVTLDDGTITAVEVTPHASDPTSAAFQEDFAANVADQVVGKPISEAKVSKVSGSSLTSQGFNAALDQIAAEAGL